MNVLAGLSFAEPLWWLAALIPIMYLLFAQTLQRARSQSIGSLALWRAALESRSQSAARRAVNWRSLMLAIAMLLCVAAMAGPRWIPEQGPKRWHLVFGTGAAGDLPVDDAGRTRLELVRREAQAFVEAHAGDDQFVFVGAPKVFDRGASAAADALVWSSSPADAEAAGPAWQAAVLAAAERDNWAMWDRADCVWFPVASLDREPVRAGLWQAAWPAVPGRIGVRGQDWFVWENDEIETRPGATPWVFAHGAIWQAPAEAGRILEAFCAAAGFQLVRSGDSSGRPEGAPLLVLWQASDDEVPSNAAAEVAWVTGAGWSAEWQLRRGLAPPTATPVGWLSAAAEPAVAWEPGLVWTRAQAMGAVSGPLANAVVEWTELFERALCLPDASVVPMARRQAASAERRSPPGLPVLPNPTPLGAPVTGVAILLLLVFLRR